MPYVGRGKGELSEIALWENKKEDTIFRSSGCQHFGDSTG